MSTADLLETLARSSTRELARRFDVGRPVAVDDLVGRRFRGRSLAQPRLIERLTWRTFRKDVSDVDADGVVRGDNVRLPQPWHRLDRPEVHEMPFVVGADDDGAVIDYRPTHRRPHPFAFAVDPLRRIGEHDGRMVLLGVTELWIGARRLRTPTWFALVPEGP